MSTLNIKEGICTKGLPHINIQWVQAISKNSKAKKTQNVGIDIESMERFTSSQAISDPLKHSFNPIYEYKHYIYTKGLF